MNENTGNHMSTQFGKPIIKLQPQVIYPQIQLIELIILCVGFILKLDDFDGKNITRLNENTDNRN